MLCGGRQRQRVGAPAALARHGHPLRLSVARSSAYLLVKYGEVNFEVLAIRDGRPMRASFKKFKILVQAWQTEVLLPEIYLESAQNLSF